MRTVTHSNKVDICFDEIFEFDLHLFEIFNFKLECQVFDEDFLRRDDYLGQIIIEEENFSDEWMKFLSIDTGFMQMKIAGDLYE